MINLLKILLLITFLFSICFSEPKKTLKLIHRHGDRTPIYGWPTNPYNDEKYWSDGFGMLTNNGKELMFSIGKYIRKRYKHFLTDNPREVYVRSTEKERCLESALLLLAGLYPPVGHWKWNSNLGKVWQPFPIRTMNLSHDGLLNPDAICPLAERETKRVKSSETVKKLFQKYENILDLIERESGQYMKDYHNLRDMFSTLLIQKLNGLKHPDWVNKSVYKTVEHFSDMAFTLDGSTKLQQKMRAGLLLKKITENIDQSIKNPNFKNKVFLYSTHDTYISIFLSALRAYNGISPPFGATIFLEFYELSDNRHEFELYYLNETTTEKAYRLSFFCGNPLDSINISCLSKNQIYSLEDFLKEVKDLIPYKWDKECQQKSFFNILAKIEL